MKVVERKKDAEKLFCSFSYERIPYLNSLHRTTSLLEINILWKIEK